MGRGAHCGGTLPANGPSRKQRLRARLLGRRPRYRLSPGGRRPGAYP
ncbi:hypothetical protein DB31_6904 [Hyalangium minutum]|uniref:Uncharacterized protein n=1 Tax=Hyalangium minutum TaxID=394096 RepID=A0A085WMT9_9BACT|nr:hypothetical protein DB31_6904 [Hyalangium minutum]